MAEGIGAVLIIVIIFLGVTKFLDLCKDMSLVKQMLYNTQYEELLRRIDDEIKAGNTDLAIEYLEFAQKCATLKHQRKELLEIRLSVDPNYKYGI